MARAQLARGGTGTETPVKIDSYWLGSFALSFVGTSGLPLCWLPNDANRACVRARSQPLLPRANGGCSGHN